MTGHLLVVGAGHGISAATAGDPPGLDYGACGEARFGTSQPGVYQKLSTRASNEAISSDSY